MERSEEANAVLSRDGESRQYGATGKPGRSPAPLKRVPTADGGSGARASGDPSQRGKQKTASAGAPRDAAATWARIDGHLARHHVRRLQVRIAKAVKARRWHKVCAWQYRLTRSFSAKLLAVKRVTSTPGRETPGSDGVRWQGARATWRATMRLRRRGDKPKSLRRVDIPQKHGKQRPLSIPTVDDRAMQAGYQRALAPVAETTADRHASGCRAGRRGDEAGAAAVKARSKPNAATWMLEADITGCYDNIGQRWRGEHSPRDREVLRQGLEAGDVADGRRYPTRQGAPQGGSSVPPWRT